MRRYFQGYYIKIASPTSCVAVIFGRHKSRKGKSAFIQVLTDKQAFNIDFDYIDFKVNRKNFLVSIKNNYLSRKGLNLNISNENLSIKCDIAFSDFTPIKYDIMGFFKYFPLMECKHTIVSMHHTATGFMELNEDTLNFDAAPSYIEGDRGRSFPQKYFWTQCNTFTDVKNLSISASVAKIPYMGLKFTGTICVILYNSKEIRLATYLGAKVKSFTQDKFIVKQGKKLLEIKILDTSKNVQSLRAPTMGQMSRTIKETIFTSVSYKFSIKNKVIFDVTSDAAAYEYSNQNKF